MKVLIYSLIIFSISLQSYASKENSKALKGEPCVNCNGRFSKIDENEKFGRNSADTSTSTESEYCVHCSENFSINHQNQKLDKIPVCDLGGELQLIQQRLIEGDIYPLDFVN